MAGFVKEWGALRGGIRGAATVNLESYLQSCVDQLQQPHHRLRVGWAPILGALAGNEVFEQSTGNLQSHPAKVTLF